MTIHESEGMVIDRSEYESLVSRAKVLEALDAHIKACRKELRGKSGCMGDIMLTMVLQGKMALCKELKKQIKGL